MTNKELRKELEKYSDDCIVMYQHNAHGRIEIDTIIHSEETLLSGNLIQTITFEAKGEE